MIVTDDCEPELPPVPMSIGMNAVSTIEAARLDSNELMIIPVNVAEIMSMRSHGIRLIKISHTVSLSYGLSVVGVIAATFWISSVASSSMTSIASSTVTIPTSRFSLSTTGTARKLYLLNTCTTFSWSSRVLTEMTFVSIRFSIVSSSSAKRRLLIVTIPMRVEWSSAT